MCGPVKTVHTKFLQKRQSTFRPNHDRGSYEPATFHDECRSPTNEPFSASDKKHR